jgi:4-hydroxybenzoate polyprenyltransferase
MLHPTIAFLRLIRANNLLMMMGTQVMAYYFLADYLITEDLFRLRFLILLLATLLTAASGYIINDYIDIKIDITNKPDKVVVGNEISRRKSMLLHLIFNVLAIYLGLMLHWKIALTIGACSLLLWFYSVVFKRMFLLGNLLIAALSAYVIIILKFFDKGIPTYLILSYACFAFGITLIREIIKDAEDLRGDTKFNCRTLPIVLGIRKTKQILIYLTVTFAATTFAHIFIGNSLITFRHEYGGIAYIFYMLLFVLAPLLFIIYQIRVADTKSDFSRLSLFCKLIMLSGILSMAILKL